MRLMYILLLITGLSASAMASDLGVYGHTYPIKEENIITYMKAKLQRMKAAGGIAQYKAEFKANVKKHVERPEPVKGLSTTLTPTHFYPDMGFVLHHDIRYANGVLMYPKGTKVNPMDYVHFDETWLFLNADDPKQVDWAKAELKKIKNRAKIILVQGDIYKAIKAFKQKVYFDQDGVFTKKFQLKHVPDLVFQEGHRMRVNEYNLDSLGSW